MKTVLRNNPIAIKTICAIIYTTLELESPDYDLNNMPESARRVAMKEVLNDGFDSTFCQDEAVVIAQQVAQANQCVGSRINPFKTPELQPFFDTFAELKDEAEAQVLAAYPTLGNEFNLGNIGTLTVATMMILFIQRHYEAMTNALLEDEPEALGHSVEATARIVSNALQYCFQYVEFKTAEAA